MKGTMIGLDVAKRVFQVHGVSEAGEVFCKRLGRASVESFFAQLEPSLIGMEACASAHHWGRRLGALGHTVRLVPPRYVKAYVRRNKTDAADAAAICEAMGRRDMHFVPVKSAAQQAALALHRTRELLVRQRTMTANALRGQLAEFGIVAAQGQAGLGQLLEMVGAPGSDLPAEARAAFAVLAGQWGALHGQIAALERQIAAWHRNDATSRRLATIPGIGPITASALAASVGDAKAFKTGRHFAAWLGLTPREWSSGMKRRQGKISKRGDGYLRRLLILGSHAVMRHHKRRADDWLTAIRARRPAGVAAVALANKTARIAWAVMARGEVYHRQPATAR
jgi:transposase